MGGFILFLVLILLVIVGVYLSVRFYTEGIIGVGRFRIRRTRIIKSTPDGRVIEDTTTTEEVSEEEPAEEAES